MTVALTALVAAGCQAGGRTGAQPAVGGAKSPSPSPSPTPTPRLPVVKTNVENGDERVPLDTRVRVGAERGKLRKVVVRDHQGQRLLGDLRPATGRWRARELLEPGMSYTVRATAESANGTTKRRLSFDSVPATLDEQTYPSVLPLEGETVGVGMPIIVYWDIPVTNRAAMERHMHVRSRPDVRGSWHWISDTEAHWRPRDFWPQGTRVTLELDVNGVDAGNGVWGQLDRKIHFRVGQRIISVVDVDTHRMNVFVGGEHARSIPISAGKPGWQTRGGTKLIMEKYRVKRMDAATVGVQPGDPEYYNIPTVPYAMRVTYSGEFVHGAPWSVADQGEANVSHGCVGMSLADAAWLYGLSHRGDVVRVKGSERPLEPGNGWTDWNMPFREYREASALS